MSWCATVGCKNQTKNCKGKNITFYSLPTEKRLKEQWIVALKRTTLPKRVYACSEHFRKEDIDPSWKLQTSLLGDNDKPKRMVLLPNSVPSIFSYNQNIGKERVSSKNRRAAAERKEVCICYQLKLIYIRVSIRICNFQYNPYFLAN